MRLAHFQRRIGREPLAQNRPGQVAKFFQLRSRFFALGELLAVEFIEQLGQHLGVHGNDGLQTRFEERHRVGGRGGQDVHRLVGLGGISAGEVFPQLFHFLGA